MSDKKQFSIDDMIMGLTKYEGFIKELVSESDEAYLALNNSLSEENNAKMKVESLKEELEAKHIINSGLSRLHKLESEKVAKLETRNSTLARQLEIAFERVKELENA